MHLYQALYTGVHVIVRFDCRLKNTQRHTLAIGYYYNEVVSFDWE
jgi:hypothetical protein